MELSLLAAAKELIVAAIIFASGTIYTSYKHKKEKEVEEQQKDHKFEKLMVMVSGIIILEKLDFFIKRGYATHEEKTQWDKTVKLYCEAGGNGQVSESHKIFMNLPSSYETRLYQK